MARMPLRLHHLDNGRVMVHLSIMALVVLIASARTEPTRVNATAFSSMVPIRFTTKGHPVIGGQAGNVPVWLLLDTGATGSCLTLPAAKRLGLKGQNVWSPVGVADGRKVEGQYYLLPHLAFGRMVYHRLLIQAADLKLVSDLAPDLGVTLDGVLGGDVLRRGGAVIDYSRGEVRLTPDWAADLMLMQGVWAAVGFENDGRPIKQSTRDNFRKVRLVISGDHMRLNMTPIGSVVLDQRLDLLLEYSPKQYASREMRVNGQLLPGDDVGAVGLYEVSQNRLRMLIPSRHIPPDKLPKSLTAALPDSGLSLSTFERLPPAHFGWPDLPLAALGLTAAVDRPLRLGGWDYAVTRDWTLTGVNAERKLRLTARLDGTVTFQPVRP